MNENALSEAQVFACCKYLREAVEARRADVDFDITPALCEIANLTERCIDIAGQHTLERRVDCLAHITWRIVADHEYAAALRAAGVLKPAETEYVCPFRGDGILRSLKELRREEARRTS